MFVRTSRVRRNGKLYEYPQLVESYRREDGTPAHRVIASLKDSSPEEVEALKEALAASKSGKRLVAVEEAARPEAPVANLRYLDAAVLLEMARQSDLRRLLSEVLPQGDAHVSPADVVLSLVLQRCMDPGSKLEASRWFPTTALPELFGVDARQFNNTRIHRVLEQLYDATPALMDSLPELYLSKRRRNSFSAMFLDLTDTFFVGHGPEMAARGKTKEGLLARKVGIVLMCDETGYPVRWEVVEGNYAESKAMLSTLRDVAPEKWSKGTPVVVDRAMGCTSHIEEMSRLGVRFLTALRSPEFSRYGTRVPFEAWAGLDVDAADDSAREAAIASAIELAEKAGFAPVGNGRLSWDCGVVEVSSSADGGVDPDAPVCGSLEAMLRSAQQLVETVRLGRATSYSAAARKLGLSEAQQKKYRPLTRLPASVQESILAGKAEHRSLREMQALLKLPREEQSAAYEELLASPTDARRNWTGRPRASRPEAFDAKKPLEVRVVAYFSPEQFVDQRLRQRACREKIDRFIATLNERLRRGRKRSERTVLMEVDRRLREDDLVSAYNVRVEESEERLQVVLTPIEEEWARRRMRHGISLLVAHPKIKKTAPELMQLYRDKDRVEKDFQVIKSVVEIRPIWHQQDLKVHAHVTLCMLALLLERHLEVRLGDLTASRALTELKTCHLNRFQGSGTAYYVPTKPTREQVRILKRLKLRRLVDADRMDRLQATFVPTC